MSRKPVRRAVSFVLIFLSLFGFLPFSYFSAVQAATLTTVADYLSRNKESLTTGVTHEIQVTPATAISGGADTNKIILVFPDGDDGLWCRTAGTDLVVSTASLRNSATALSASGLTARCTQGSGASSYDTLYVESVDNLSASTLYGVKVSDGSTGKLGTPTAATTGVITVKANNGSSDVDTAYIAVDIITNDEVAVSGRVDPTLSFAIDTTTVGFGTITSGALRYATSDTNGSGSAPGNGDPITLTLSTNADDGAVIELRDQNTNATSGLYSTDTGTTLASAASTAVSAGTANFGAYGKNASGLTIAESFDHDSTADVAISTTFQTLASVAAPVSNGSLDVSLVSAVAGATPAGAYSDTLTIIATGKF